MSALEPSGAGVLMPVEVEDALVGAIAAGVPIKTALVAAGISRSVFFEWMQIAQGKEAWHDGSPVSEAIRGAASALSDRITRAKAQRVVAAVQRLETAARTPDKFGRPDWRADTWLLSHSPEFREDWGERVEMRHTGEVNHHLHEWARNASTAELIEAAPELAALLPPEDWSPPQDEPEAAA